MTESNAMKCLIVREPFASEIVDGVKPIEFRSRSTNIRGRIGIIAAGSKTIIGEVDLVDCQRWEDETSYTYEWVISSPLRYSSPRSYQHQSGAQVWINVP
jgi:hypothetical protein